VIEARIEELGGEPHDETVAERAARLDRSLKFSEKRKRFLNSEEGVKAANIQFDALHKELEQLIAVVKESTNSLSFQLEFVPRQIILLGPTPAVSIDWMYHYVNSLDKAKLEVTLWRGHPPFPGVMHIDKPTKLKTKRFTFDLLPNEEPCWVLADTLERSYTTMELASFILKYCMDEAEARKDQR